MPTNLYGPNDNFNLETSHGLPARNRKIHLAKGLQENNWKALREDLNRRPVEGVDGSASEADIVRLLHKDGIEKDCVNLWGSGKPMREFLWSEEMADASVYVMERVDFSDLITNKKEIINTHINIGTGKEISIHDVAVLIQQTLDYQGAIRFDSSKPDGTMRKLTDVNKLHALGWYHAVEIEEGIERLYKWYINYRQ